MTSPESDVRYYGSARPLALIVRSQLLLLVMQKHGRTYHLPISLGATSDDKVMTDLDRLMVDDLLITEKMDGENTTIHNDGSHARSPDSRYHPSRDWLKALAAGISPKLAPNERVVGENLYARHSIGYDDLASYFLGFAWVIGDEIQSWDETLGRFAQLGIVPVPTLYRGPFSAGLFERIASSLDLTKQEGFVVRVAGAFRCGRSSSQTAWLVDGSRVSCT